VQNRTLALSHPACQTQSEMWISVPLGSAGSVVAPAMPSGNAWGALPLILVGSWFKGPFFPKGSSDWAGTRGLYFPEIRTGGKVFRLRVVRVPSPIGSTWSLITSHEVLARQALARDGYA